MPKKIPLRQMPPILDGVIVKRKQLARQREALDVISAARRQALAIVKQAYAEAEQHRRQGFQDGFQEGMVTSAAAVADYLSQRRHMEVELQGKINERARALLSTALESADCLLALVDEWLASLPPPVLSEPMVILLPQSARGSHALLKQRIAEAWTGKGHIEYHSENRVVMKYGHQIAEFAPEAFINESARRLNFFNDMPEQCRRLTESGLRRLHEVFLQQHAAGTTHAK